MLAALFVRLLGTFQDASILKSVFDTEKDVSSGVGGQASVEKYTVKSEVVTDLSCCELRSNNTMKA
jgi:hypothetical protein